MAESNELAPVAAPPQNEIATLERDISNKLLYGGGKDILVNADATLRTRGGGKGLAIYDELERDCHAGAVLDKRRRGVTSRDWHVVPATEDAKDVQVAEFVTEVLEDVRFDQLTHDLLDATLKGFAIVELIWGIYDWNGGQFLAPVNYFPRDQKRFVFDKDRKPRLLTRQQPVDGEVLPERKFIVHTFNSKDGVPYGLGLGSKLFWPIFFKRQNVTFWLTFNDKFGNPTALGKYPPGTPVPDQENLLNALKAISQEASITFPIGMEVELLEAARSGAADGYERLCRYMDEQVSEAVLGETLTTTVGDKGTQALGTVHEGVREEVAKNDSDNLSYTLNETLVKWIVELNFPGRPVPTVWRLFEQPEDLDKLADRDSKLSTIGYVPDEERVRKTYGEGYVKKESPKPTPGPGGAADFAEATVRQADRLAKELDPVTTEWIDKIRATLEKATSLEEFRDKLVDVFPDMGPDEMADTMRRALAAAAMAGRFDILEQAR